MTEINFVVKYDDTFTDQIDALNQRMNDLHRDYVANHDSQGIIERFRKSVEYKLAYYRWKRLCSKSHRLARRWVEYEGRVFDINWEKTGGYEARRQIADILENEKIQASKDVDAKTDVG